MINTLSPEQQTEIDKIVPWWIENASRPIDKDNSKAAIATLYGLNGLKPPEIVFCASPQEAIASLRDSLRDSLWASLRASLWASLRASLRDSLQDSLGDSLEASLRASLRDSLEASLRASLGDSLRDSLWASLRDSLRDSLGDCLCIFGWSNDAALLQAGAIAGVQFDREKYDKFRLICRELFWIFPYQNVCYVCDRPRFIGWQDGVVHASDRAAIEFADGFKVWAIDGVWVDEQIVMSPETQTIVQIRNEENEEIRRIRIERFGWSRFLIEAGAEVVDFQQSPGGWLESLMRCDDMTVLCTYDPSTGRPYSLEVDPSCETCEQAQRYLLAPELAFEGIEFDHSEIEVYPVLRT